MEWDLLMAFYVNAYPYIALKDNNIGLYLMHCNTFIASEFILIVGLGFEFDSMLWTESYSWMWYYFKDTHFCQP